MPSSASASVLASGLAVALACMAVTCVLSGVSVCAAKEKAAPVWDPKGYVYFCPCMGRFGNQVEYYLGVMKMAKELDRTLILPPFVEYTRTGGRRFPRFSEYFDVRAVNRYNRAIEAHEFIAAFGGADQPFAPANRVAYCWGDPNKKPAQCNMKNGQPSIDFWGHQGLEFDRFEHYTMSSRFGADNALPQLWASRFPAAKHPVLTFTGSPASLPMERENWPLQQYMTWNTRLRSKARKFIKNHLQLPYLAVHLRVGSDWKSSCQNAHGLKSWMSAVQCLQPGEVVTPTLCYQDAKHVVYAVTQRAKAIGARSVFVATDAADYIAEMGKANPDLKFVRYTDPKTGFDDPAMDLVLLGESDHFIGNCVSSYTAMVKRARDLQNRQSSWFGYGDEPVTPPAGGDSGSGSGSGEGKKKRRIREDL